MTLSNAERQARHRDRLSDRYRRERGNADTLALELNRALDVITGLQADREAEVSEDVGSLQLALQRHSLLRANPDWPKAPA